MAKTNDGFVIAEKDLEMRGPGELLGNEAVGTAGVSRRQHRARSADSSKERARKRSFIWQKASNQRRRRR